MCCATLHVFAADALAAATARGAAYAASLSALIENVAERTPGPEAVAAAASKSLS